MCRLTFAGDVMSMRRLPLATCVAAVVAAATFSTEAVTRLPSADGQFWDIQDTSPWAQDSGGIATGGRANPFNGFGYLKIRVRSGSSATLVPNRYLSGFGLARDGERFDSITPLVYGGVVVARAIYAPQESIYLRYFDSYTNATGEDRVVDVAWGGASGAFEDGGRLDVATTSDGDRRIDLDDTFVVVMQNARNVSDPMRGPSGHGPSAHVLGSHVSGVLSAVGDMYADPFTDRWPGYDPAHIGYVFTLTIRPGQTVALMTFVAKGLSEIYDPRGGFPIPIRDGIVAPKSQAPYAGDSPNVPEPGSDIGRVAAAARRLAAERAASRARGPLHGIPVAFKDNIDVFGLPTTGGSRALVDHRPRLDSRVAAGMRRAGAVVLGKTNLDEFPFGDFGISTVGGTIGNAYDPSLSTAGSSGGTAVAVSTSLVTLGFGTDTCNSLSNPAAFASLATIRTTRGLPSRAGVMPLNTYNDAVGPIAKSVRELALVLDQVTGRDPEDEATVEADRDIDGSFTAALDAGALMGAHVGVMRQLFVGVTGEREAAATMENVVAELRTAGATVVDVAIPNLDAAYLQARGSAPGSLKAGWTSYLTRGAAPGDAVLTIDNLLASGKLAPDSARRLQDAIQPTPAGAALRAATDRFYASREEFRALFVDLLERQRLDVLLYPANQARPHTHEGGLERYGGEPGTCEESAMTGLPQVTVPAGFLGKRYPFGVSFLGRPWADRRTLAIAYAYEQATHHRVPPPRRP